MCDSHQAVARCASTATTRGASTAPSTTRRLRSSRRPARVAFWLVAALLGSCRGVVQAQQDDYDYGGYGQQQQAPMRAGGGGEGGGLMKPLAAVATSFMAMKLIFSRHRKKASIKALEQEQRKWAQMKKEDLQEINQQFTTMEATLTASLNEKVAQSRQLEQILYSLPDTDQNGLITRYEFDKYMNDYKRSHPGLTDRDLPRFEDMDHNNNGHINFHEWEEYQMMAMNAMA